MPEQLQKVLTQFQINESIIYMFFMVIILYALLKFLVLNKVSMVIMEREHRTLGRQGAATESKEELVGLKTQFEEKMKNIRIETAKTLESKKTKALNEQKEILKKAKEEAAQKVKESRSKVENSLKSEMLKIEKEIPEIAKLIVQKFMTDKTNSGVGISEKSTGA